MKSSFNLQLLASLLAAVPFLATFGCAAPGPPQPPSLELPLPVSDLKAIRKGDKVLLTWTLPAETTDGDAIRVQGPTRICRTQMQDQADCGVPIAELTDSELDVSKQDTAVKSPGRGTAHFADTLPAERLSDPQIFIAYTIESLNPEKRGAGISNPARVSAAHTEPPPTDFRAELTAAGVILTWKGPLLSLGAGDGTPRNVYRVHRTLVGSPVRTLVGEVLMGRQSEMRLVDPNFTWEHTYEYRIEVATHVDARFPDLCALTPASPECSKPIRDAIDVEGEDSPPIKIVAHDIFPPAVPTALQAVFSGEGQKPFIDLTWLANTDSDLAGYNVYRHQQGGQSEKLTFEAVKAPSFRDANTTSGKTYFYTVTAVDIHGNESAQSEETSEQVP